MALSNYGEALRQLLELDLSCPKCGERNIPHAQPTLEREQDGSYTCRTCARNFRPEEK